MKTNKMLYEKNVNIFPCIDVSEDLNSLKQLNVTLTLGKGPKIIREGNEILILRTFGERYEFEWFGDCAEFKDPVSAAFFFVGFINCYLIGYGTIPFSINKRELNKVDVKWKIYHDQKITLKDSQGCSEAISVQGFIFKMPYKEFEPSFDLIKFFSGFKPGDSGWDNIKKQFVPSYQWKNGAPIVTETDLGDLWRDAWVLYRLNIYNPEGPFNHKWITPCRHTDYQYDKLAMWDTLHIVENIKWYDVKTAEHLLEMQFGLFRASDGMVAQDRSCGGVLDGDIDHDRIDGNNFSRTQPPMWSYSFLELSKLIGNYDICGNAFELMVKNIRWWEENRFFPEFKLFGYNMLPGDMANESGLDNSPRFVNVFNGKKWKRASRRKNRRLIAADLNAQMADYYQNLGVIAMMKNDERSSDYFSRAERLIDNMQKYLWNEDFHFFFDYDIDQKLQQPIFASSAFWTLFGGCVLKGKVDGFLENLTDPRKFWTELPVPTIALDSNFFENDMWQGPTWLSQNYWFIIGLKRYNYGGLAAQLAEKCFNYLKKSYYNYHKFYEFYNPNGYSQKVLKRKGKSPGPPADYVGHFPIHSLYYYGILGAEILDESVSFIPYWNNIDSDLKIELYYDNNKHTLSAVKGETKILQVAREFE
ncbi:MAG: hypothetical protein GF364_07655 [Candidatus Lokiarchaeota archaeon]|nr:hypothetical protein [Candidatus Lokiarchaeota archaeon]